MANHHDKPKGGLLLGNVACSQGSNMKGEFMKRMFEGVCVVMFIAVLRSILVCIDGVESLFEPVVELEYVVEVVVVPDTVWQLISCTTGSIST